MFLNITANEGYDTYLQNFPLTLCQKIALCSFFLYFQFVHRETGNRVPEGVFRLPETDFSGYFPQSLCFRDAISMLSQCDLIEIAASSACFCSARNALSCCHSAPSISQLIATPLAFNGLRFSQDFAVAARMIFVFKSANVVAHRFYKVSAKRAKRYQTAKLTLLRITYYVSRFNHALLRCDLKVITKQPKKSTDKLV